MKPFLILLLVGCLQVTAFSQTDKRLTERLDSVLKATEKLDFTTVMKFTYPKIFTLVPEDQLAEVMRQAFNSEDFAVSLDSVKVKKIYPSFTMQGGNYTVIRHSMRMKLGFKETIDTADKEAFDILMNSFQQGFGKENVNFEATSNSFIVTTDANLLAIKDQHSPEWSFLNIQKEASAFADKLLSKELQNKLKEYEK